VQAFGWREICCSSFSAHNRGYRGREDAAQYSVLIILGVMDL
jgi:hypothetical protein